MDIRLKECCLDIIQIFQKKGCVMTFRNMNSGFQLLIGKTIFQVCQGERQLMEDNVTAIKVVWIESGSDFHDFLEGVTG